MPLLSLSLFPHISRAQLFFLFKPSCSPNSSLKRSPVLPSFSFSLSRCSPRRQVRFLSHIASRQTPSVAHPGERWLTHTITCRTQISEAKRLASCALPLTKFANEICEQRCVLHLAFASISGLLQ